MAKVTGKVLGDNGKPISGVTVNLYNDETLVEADTTGSDGSFTIDNPGTEASNGTIEFIKSGYLRIYYPSNNVSNTILLEKDTDYLSKVPMWVYIMAAIVLAGIAYYFITKQKK